MADLHHIWAGDLAPSPTGDILLAAGPPLGTQRVLRRLLTDPGAYLWHPGYGAGLGRFVGEPADPRAIAALIRAQMGREPAVAPAPEPVVTVRGDPGGTLAVQVRYADAETAETRTLDLPRPE